MERLSSISQVSLGGPVQPGRACTAADAARGYAGCTRPQSVKSGMEVLVQEAGRYLGEWDAAQARTADAAAQLPKSVRPLFEAQLLVNRLSLQSQVAAKVADGFGSMLRRLQQLGS